MILLTVVMLLVKACPAFVAVIPDDESVMSHCYAIAFNFRNVILTIWNAVVKCKPHGVSTALVCEIPSFTVNAEFKLFATSQKAFASPSGCLQAIFDQKVAANQRHGGHSSP